MWYLLHSLRSILAKFGLAAVISPASVTGKVKGDDFDLSPDLGVTSNPCKKIFKLT